MANTDQNVEEKGLIIKISLTQTKKTQRWLLGELHKRGFITVDERLLSKILTGKYPYRLGREVLATADEILAEENEATKTSA